MNVLEREAPNFWRSVFNRTGRIELYDSFMKVKKEINKEYCFKCHHGSLKCCISTQLPSKVLDTIIAESSLPLKSHGVLYGCYFLTSDSMCAIEEMKPKICLLHFCRLGRTKPIQMYRHLIIDQVKSLLSKFNWRENVVIWLIQHEDYRQEVIKRLTPDYNNLVLYPPTRTMLNGSEACTILQPRINNYTDYIQLLHPILQTEWHNSLRYKELQAMNRTRD